MWNWADPLGLCKEVIENKDDYLFRGVSATHPVLKEAKRGKIVPGDVNGTVTPEQHAMGGVADKSPYSSFTPDINYAKTHANKEGPGGVIVAVPKGAPPPNSTWEWGWTHINDWGEVEMLLKGPRSGGIVIDPGTVP